MRPPPRPPSTSGSLMRIVTVAVAQRRREQHHRIVEHGGFAFAHAFQLPQQVGVLLDVPAIDELILPQLIGVLLMMRHIVMAGADAFAGTGS